MIQTAHMAVVARKNAGGGPPPLAAFSDDFAGTLAKWTINTGNWDINGGALRMNDGGFVDSNITFTDDTLTTTSGYFRAVRGDDASFPRFGFRYSNDDGAHYALEISNTLVGWYYYPTIGGSPTQIGGNFVTTTGIGTVIAITWELGGTGAGTRVRVWIDPTGDTPTGINDWGGAAADQLWENETGTAVNSGAYVFFGGSQGTANTNKWDNFFGGDVP